MAVLERVTTLLRANLNDLLDRAEDPEKLLKQLLIDMNEQLIQVRTQTAISMGDQRKLRRLWEDNERKAQQWQHKAEISVQVGDDDLAKQALARRNSYADLTHGFRRQHDEQAAQVAVLREALDQLEAKVQTVQAKKELLIARSKQARTQIRIHETLGGADPDAALNALERMEAKVDVETLRANALSDLDSNTIEARFQEMEQADKIERQLREIKDHQPWVVDQHAAES